MNFSSIDFEKLRQNFTNIILCSMETTRTQTFQLRTKFSSLKFSECKINIHKLKKKSFSSQQMTKDQSLLTSNCVDYISIVNDILYDTSIYQLCRRDEVHTSLEKLKTILGRIYF